MPRSSRRRRSSRSASGPWLGLALIFVAVVCAGGLAFAYFTVQRPVLLDKESLCPVDGPRGATVLLIDTSDDLPAITKQEVIRRLMDLADDVSTFELFDVRILDASHQTSRSVFARCNPGDGKGLSEWTANPALARKRWLQSFRGPVTEALSGSLSGPDAKTSPIMAAIQSIAVDRFTGNLASKGTRRLVLVSDMIEFEADYSQYTGDLSFQRFKRSTAYRKFSTDLHGADVSILYVQRLRKRPVDQNAHIRFWTEWFSENNGRLRGVDRLQGAG